MLYVSLPDRCFLGFLGLDSISKVSFGNKIAKEVYIIVKLTLISNSFIALLLKYVAFLMILGGFNRIMFKLSKAINLCLQRLIFIFIKKS